MIMPSSDLLSVPQAPRRCNSDSALYSRVLTLETVSPVVRKMDNPVRGAVSTRATELEFELTQGIKKPFKSIIWANIGDSQAIGRSPVTYFRKLLACCIYPELLQTPAIPDDIKEKALVILAGFPSQTLGSYTETAGIASIRKDVAAFICKRDGIANANAETIFLSNGASEAIKAMLKMFADQCNPNGKPVGVLIPLPGYPLYAGTLREHSLVPIEYHLKEKDNWKIDVNELEFVTSNARKHCEPRALCVINPGNPAGNVLARRNIEEIIEFAYNNHLFLLADEVYQDNVYGVETEFVSFRKIVLQSDEPYCSLELASFNSVSKGYMAECGQRGGYVEIINMDEDVLIEFRKLLGSRMCSNVNGQVAVACLVNPPQLGDESFAQFAKEKEGFLDSLAQASRLLHERLNLLEGVTCNQINGAIYAFPRIFLPQLAIDEAEDHGQPPDVFYALCLLEETGICVTPGSAFGQESGTYHIRFTLLPSLDKMYDMVERLETFHNKFVQKYGVRNVVTSLESAPGICIQFPS